MTRNTARHRYCTDGGQSDRDVRRPAVAGQFYDVGQESLREQIQRCFEHDIGPDVTLEEWEGTRDEAPRALVAPHAGYPFSGPVAAHGYATVLGTDIDTVVIFGPNHDGVGTSVAVAPHDAWRTPLGDVPVDTELATALVESSDATFDSTPHRNEHSIEVQIPFLQVCLSDFSVVPVALTRPAGEEARRLGRAVARLARDDFEGRDVAVVSSTDLTHYQPHEQATASDERILDAIADLDTAAIERAVTDERHSMCGPWSTIAGLEAAREFGHDDGTVLSYATSGQTGGDRSRVVGYCAAVV